MKLRQWYKLDNIGKFYSFTNSTVPTIFRYSVTLSKKVEEDILTKAVNEALKEFPNFSCHLKRGFFWYYLEASDKKIKIEEEKNPICDKIYKDGDDFLFRVNYYNTRINLEVSHILSDGRGSLFFFKNIIYRYLKIKEHIEDVEIEGLSSMYEKTEDSFEKYYTKPRIKRKTTKKIYQYLGKKKRRTTYIEYHISTKQVQDLAKKYHVTITALLLGVLISAYYNQMKENDKKKIIKIDVPVDLRNFFKSATSRNFFGITSIIYDCSKVKKEDFTNILKIVEEQLKESITKEQLKVRMNEMIGLEKNIAIRIVPIGIKDFCLRLADKFINNSTTSSLSNIGKITVDEKIAPFIKNFNVLTTTTSLQMTICSYKDDLSIGISSKYINNDIIKDFCRFFSQYQIEGIININEEDEDEKM